MRTGRPPYLRSFNYVGLHRYFLTFCTFRRRPIFIDGPVVDGVWSQFQRAAERQQFAVLAYCFMPDHLHLLIGATGECADARRFAALAKQLSGYHFSKAQGAPLWQRYGYERVLRGDDDLLGVARYILENPVRARLVECPEHYPFSGCPGHSIEAVLEAIAWKPPRSG